MSELTEQELESPLWKKIEAHYKERLDIARKQNDSYQPENQTNLLRGEIRAYKSLLRLNPKFEN